jgi:uncharacterized protein (TIGR02679 family)
MTTDLERLQRLLGGEALLKLRAQLRERYARGLATEVFTLNRLDPGARRALEGLLGRGPRQADSMKLSLAELDAAVQRAGLAADFRAALEVLDGVIVDRRAARVASARAWDSVFETVNDARLAALLSGAQGRGLVKRLTQSKPPAAGALLREAERVLSRLPARGIPMARLAAETTGNAHALDEGRPLSTLVLAAIAPALDLGDDPENARPRNRWALLGVSVNELSAPVLVLNLPASGAGHGSRLTEAAGRTGEPVHLSLRTLLREPPCWRVAGRRIFVCENPTVVTVAADVLAEHSAPLVCTDGMPSASQRILLNQLVQAGAALLYHGDFDWPGIRIGNWMSRTLHASPWQFGAADYIAHVADSHRTLDDLPVAALWDPELSPAMSKTGRALEEEAVLDQLLRDLGA